MTVVINSVQTTLINGINYSMMGMNELGASAPAYLDANVEAGLDRLQDIGLGSEPEVLKGPIHMLALHEHLSAQPGIAINEQQYLDEHAQEIAALLYALCNRISMEDAQLALGGLTIFDDDMSIQDLWAFQPDIVEQDTDTAIDFDTGMNVSSFSRYVQTATGVWLEYHDKIKALDTRPTADERDAATTELIVELLKSNHAVRHVLRYFYLTPDFLNRFPITLEWNQIEAYTTNKDAFDQLLKETLLAPLPHALEGKLEEKDWQDLWRDYWRACIGVAEMYPESDSIPVEARQDIAATHQIWLVKVAQKAHLPFPPTWTNLWGRGWNPLSWW